MKRSITCHHIPELEQRPKRTQSAPNFVNSDILISCTASVLSIEILKKSYPFNELSFSQTKSDDNATISSDSLAEEFSALVIENIIQPCKRRKRYCDKDNDDYYQDFESFKPALRQNCCALSPPISISMNACTCIYEVDLDVGLCIDTVDDYEDTPNDSVHTT